VSRGSASARSAGRFIGCKVSSTSLDDIPHNVNLILIAVPHDAIANVSEAISRVGHLATGRLAVCHTSGMLTASALDHLALQGAVTFSFHPLQTFPRDFHPKDILEGIKGISYGIDGSTRGVRTAKQLAQVLGGRIVIIPPHLRVFYHAACVAASNHLTALMHIVEVMFGAMQQKQTDFFKVFRPIIETTMRNIEKTSPARALSGPVARGGVETIAGHLSAIQRERPDLIPYFVRMTAETMRLAIHKGSISDEARAAMAELLRSYEPQLQEPT
jgi:predicted short-subunit dehydrogenase-like oxidoreductase (DUF2520 family)